MCDIGAETTTLFSLFLYISVTIICGNANCAIILNDLENIASPFSLHGDNSQISLLLHGHDMFDDKNHIFVKSCFTFSRPKCLLG